MVIGPGIGHKLIGVSSRQFSLFSFSRSIERITGVDNSGEYTRRGEGGGTRGEEGEENADSLLRSTRWNKMIRLL